MSTTPQDGKTAHTTLWSQGRKGDIDWMRVTVNPARRVEVHYKDRHNARRMETFPLTAQGKKDAVKWAKEFAGERKLGQAPRGPTTHAALWRAYTESPAWLALRDRSRPSYTARWAKWANFRGAATPVDDTTLLHIDKFITASVANGTAMNQVRMAISVARLVYNWGLSRDLVTRNAFAGYRWKTPAGMEAAAPGEYTEDQYTGLLTQLSPQDGRRWRGQVALMLGGHHGQRASAVLHLTWDDIVDGDIVWPSALQKNKKVLLQPLTWDGLAALETARYWRTVLGYEGKWVLFAGGGNKKLGAAVTRSASRRRATGTQTAVSTRKVRTPAEDTPYTYGGLWRALRDAETRAGIAHEQGRAFHGLRRMNAGNVHRNSRDAGLAMKWIGNDIAQANRYLKTRDPRMVEAAAAAETGAGSDPTDPTDPTDGGTPARTWPATSKPATPAIASDRRRASPPEVRLGNLSAKLDIVSGGTKGLTKSQRSGLNRRPLVG